MRRLLPLAPIAALGLLAACSNVPVGPKGDPIEVGSVLNPYCAEDGSIVQRIYPNDQGRYDTAQSSPDNCPWNRNR